jgi:hypothetical protein
MKIHILIAFIFLFIGNLSFAQRKVKPLDEDLAKEQKSMKTPMEKV